MIYKSWIDLKLMTPALQSASSTYIMRHTWGFSQEQPWTKEEHGFHWFPTYINTLIDTKLIVSPFYKWGPWTIKGIFKITDYIEFFYWPKVTFIAVFLLKCLNKPTKPLKIATASVYILVQMFNQPERPGARPLFATTLAITHLHSSCSLKQQLCNKSTFIGF